MSNITDRTAARSAVRDDGAGTPLVLPEGGTAAAEGPRETSGVVQSVDRALTVLALLARSGELGVTQLAAGLGVHKSTAFRLLATLEAHDLVEQVADRGKFRLGVGLLRLAGAGVARLDLVQESRPVAVRLAHQVGETVDLTILSGCGALYLDQVPGPSALALHNGVGQVVPLHATAHGKVLLAFGPPELTEGLARSLPRFTARTTGDADRLRAELAEVEGLGFAVTVDELEVGLTAVAAPVRSAEGEVTAAVGASGPTFRLPPERLPAIADQVVAAAAEISRRLGWLGSAAPHRG